MRNERAAPRFDPSRPRELSRFFEDLEQLMERAQITDEVGKKKQAVRYAEFDTEQIWKTFPEFKDATVSYDDFKKAIMAHYPDATGDFVYSLRDMDLLIGERQRLGIATAKDLSDYHLQFIAITTWLIEKKQLGDLEQQRAYIRAFQQPLLSAISNRLQLKKPDHHPNIPYKVSEVYDAARFILQGAPSLGFTSTPPPASSFSPSIDNGLKIENLAPFMAEFTKTIVDALKSSNPPNRSTRAWEEIILCIMCGGKHTIPNCPVVEDFIKAGKCRRNQEHKVVLPTGAFVPRSIPGKNLAERIEEWHRRNPNQLAAATLIHTIDRRLIQESQLLPVVYRSENPTFTLSSNERIATLEAELYNLKKAKENPIATVRTRAQKARERPEDDDEREVTEARKAIPRIEEVEDIDAAPRQPSVPIPSSQPTIPEHPYRNAKDAAYAPPVNRNIAAKEKPNTFKRPDPAYKTLPPIHDPAVAATVYKRSMDAPITVTQRELLSLSPEIRSQVREATTTRRFPNKDGNTAQHYLDYQEDDDYETQHLLNTVTEIIPTFAIENAHHRTPPTGSIVVPDPIETYYRSLRPGETPDPDRLVVAIESGAVRSVFATIDHSQKKECILDPGCQIVAMSEASCHDLGLAYDPSIVLNMQSANGNINQSLGLSRNVPFQIGSITFYLQVHVIHSPAYDVLLGRPFDILTESVVRNFANEDQTITIHDPNTGQRVTVPTLPRSQKNRPCPHHRKKDF